MLRNFSTDPKSFSVSQYSSSRLMSEVGLSRQRMVIMALLLGCDYNLGGVNGVGREGVIKLFSVWGEPGHSDLDNVMAWSDTDHDTNIVTSKPVHCATCGHMGSVATHRKHGCDTCSTGSGCGGVTRDCRCQYHDDNNQRLLTEWSVKQKAVVSPGWPFLHVVKEFYRDISTLPSKFQWSRPVPDMFVEFCVRKMDWLQDYCVEKVIDTVVRWQVRNPSNVLVSPVEIMKKRIRSGENMFEIQWSSTNSSLPSSFSACASATEFSESFPHVYAKYVEMLEAKEAAKKKPRKKKEKENVAPKEKKSKAKKTADAEKQPTMDHFVKKPVVEEEVVKLKPKTLVLTKLTSADPKFNNKIIAQKLITPDTSNNISMESVTGGNKSDSYIYKASPDNMETSDNSLSESTRMYLEEEEDDSDLSDIIDEIVGKKRSEPIQAFSTSTPSYLQPQPLANLQNTQRYTTGSPLLRKVQQNVIKEKVKPSVKASDVFDMSDMSFVLEDCSRSDEASDKKPTNLQDDDYDDLHFSKEDSFDEFDCLDKPSTTPLADRLKRKF